MEHYVEIVPEKEGKMKIIGKDQHWNNFTFIKNIESDEKVHESDGFEYTIPM